MRVRDESIVVSSLLLSPLVDVVRLLMNFSLSKKSIFGYRWGVGIFCKARLKGVGRLDWS
jgi:hypothetical protein